MIKCENPQSYSLLARRGNAGNCAMSIGLIALYSTAVKWGCYGASNTDLARYVNFTLKGY